MLQVRNVTILHKKDYRELLKDFSFALNPGGARLLKKFFCVLRVEKKSASWEITA